MSSYKLSIYILLFEDLEGEFTPPVLFLAAWFSETTNRQGNTLPLMWMVRTIETGESNMMGINSLLILLPLFVTPPSLVF
jgi:hypothetical protein